MPTRRRVEEDAFRTDSKVTPQRTADPASTPPGTRAIGAFDASGRLVTSAPFEIVFRSGG